MRDRFGGPIFEKQKVKQEFTHVATPEENTYIEAFHSILKHDVIERTEFASYYEANETLQRYFSHYNYCRLHLSLGFVTLQQKWEEAEVGCATTLLQKICPVNRETKAIIVFTKRTFAW